jgi:hypothetical protein
MTFLTVCLLAMSSDLHPRKFIIDTDPGKEKASAAIGTGVSSSALFTYWSGGTSVLLGCPRMMSFCQASLPLNDIIFDYIEIK